MKIISERLFQNTDKQTMPHFRIQDFKEYNREIEWDFLDFFQCETTDTVKFETKYTWSTFENFLSLILNLGESLLLF